MSFIICFHLLFIGLSQSQDQSYRFGKLIWVKSGCFFIIFFLWGFLGLGSMTQVMGLTDWFGSFFMCFFNWYLFLSLILQHWTDWELNLIICFNILSMRLSRFYDSSHKFNKLTQVAFSGFFFQFHPFALSWLKIRLYNLFWFVFNEIIIVLQLGSRILHVNPGWTKSIQYVILILKKMSSWKFLSQTMFLQVIWVAFGPVKSTRSHQVNPHKI